MHNVPQSHPADQHDRISALVGYADIEQWAGAASPFRLVYVYMQPEPRTVSNGRRSIDVWTINLQQRAEDGSLHYCRIPVLPITAVMEKEIEDLAMGYLGHVVRWLRTCHYDLIPGLYAVPTGADLLEARCPFVNWDAIGNRFIRTDQEGGGQ